MSFHLCHSTNESPFCAISKKEPRKNNSYNQRNEMGSIFNYPLYDKMADKEDIMITLIPLRQFFGLEKNINIENIENPKKFSLAIFPSQKFGWEMLRLEKLLASQNVRV